MKTYQYAWNDATANRFEKHINELGKVGWRVIYVKWFPEKAVFYYLVEKETVSHD